MTSGRIYVVFIFVAGSNLSQGSTVSSATNSAPSSGTKDIARLSLSSSVTSTVYNALQNNNTDSYNAASDHGRVNDLKLEENDEKKLLDALMKGYDRDVRPVRNASHPIAIQLGITLTQIFDMDEKNQVLTTNVWLDQEWVDELLSWDPALYNGLETIRLPCEKIWLPDIVLYNNADDYTRGYMNSRAMVSYRGKVFWPPPTKFRSACPVDVTYFPFDDQTCILKLGSWIYDGFQVDVTNRTAEVDMSNYIPNGEWELLDAKIVRNVIFYSCCPEPFPDVTITITIRRKTLYYMYNVVLPCMMMSVLTLLVFCLPPDSGEKIALGVTVLLAFSVFMLAIAEKMPETSESIPLIGIYLTAVMTITSVSIIMTVVVLNCHYRGPIQKEVPPWMRRYFLNANVVRRMISSSTNPRARGVFVSKVRRKWMNFKGSRRRSTKASSCTANEDNSIPKIPNSVGSYGEEILNNVQDHLIKPDSFRLNADGIGQNMNDNHQGDYTTNTDDVQSSHVGWSSNHATGSTLKLNHTNSPLNIGSSNCAKSQEEILRALRILVGKQEREDTNRKRLNEWRIIAITIDRILFWVFFLITTVSSLVFLVILPVLKRAEYQRNT